MRKNRLNLILSFILVALIAVGALTSCSDDITISLAAASEIPAQDIGEGEKTFRFEVFHNIEPTTVWNIHTDETTVGSALFEVGLTDDKGFITVVNGLTADWEADNAYWAFYINGEFALTGANTVDIEEDKTYAFVYTQD